MFCFCIKWVDEMWMRRKNTKLLVLNSLKKLLLKEQLKTNARIKHRRYKWDEGNFHSGGDDLIPRFSMIHFHYNIFGSAHQIRKQTASIQVMLWFTFVCRTASSIASTTGSSKLMLPHFTGSKLTVGTVFSQSWTSDNGEDLQKELYPCNFCSTNCTAEIAEQM